MEDQSVNASNQYAGFWIRTVAHIIDQVILLGVVLIISLPIGLVLGMSTVSDNGNQQLLYLVLIVQHLYYGLMESSKYQATVGKLITGLKVT